jgi:hypothetical protein
MEAVPHARGRKRAVRAKAGVSRCHTCHHAVTGSVGDTKTCVMVGGRNLVLCTMCFRNDPRLCDWLDWHIGRASAVIDPK